MQTTASKTSHDHYKAAVALKNRILDGRANEKPVQAWAAVVRECVKAESKFHAENEGRVYGRSHHSFLNNIGRVHWAARAQVETLARIARGGAQ